MQEALDLLENSTFVEVLLCIVSGKDYSSAIAKALKKSQPTVTEQLKQLEAVGLIKALKRDKAQKYGVNWDLLFEILYGVIRETTTLRQEYYDKDELRKIEQTNLENVIPRGLFKGFLKEYSSTLRDLGGKRKGLDEIIFSFFSAINKLEKSDWKKLVSEFKVDEKNLATIAESVEFEIYGVELTALQVFLDINKTRKSNEIGKRNVGKG